MEIKKFLTNVSKNKAFQRALDNLVEAQARVYRGAYQKMRNKRHEINDSANTSAWLYYMENGLDESDALDQWEWRGVKAFAEAIPLTKRTALIDESLETIDDESVVFWDTEEAWKDPEVLRALSGEAWVRLVSLSLGGDKGAREVWQNIVNG